MKYVIWALALVLWPLSSFGQKWYAAPPKSTIVPYQNDALEQASFGVSDKLTCYVGWMKRNRAVVFYAWEKQPPVPLKNKPNERLERVHFIEAVLDADSAKLREANLGKVNLAPYGSNIPDLLDGEPNFRKHPCLAAVHTIPSSHIRGVMVRFKKHVEENPNDIHVRP